jgi:hypothetical protein
VCGFFFFAFFLRFPFRALRCNCFVVSQQNAWVHFVIITVIFYPKRVGVDVYEIIIAVITKYVHLLVYTVTIEMSFISFVQLQDTFGKFV